jgi:peroxiredoxin
LSLLLGCAGGEQPGSPQPSDVQTGTRKGNVAPDFALPFMGKPGRLKLSDQRGKVVLLAFWASWCGPCRIEMPALDKAWLQYKGKDVVFLGISVDEDPLSAERFLDEVPVGFPSLIDTSGHVSGGEWRVSSLPTTVVLDRSGVVRSRHLGYTPKQLQQSLNLIDDLLEEPAP